MRRYLAYLGLRAGAGLVGALPVGFIRSMGDRVGRWWAYFDRDSRNMAKRHLSRVLANGSDVESASFEMMGEYGRYYAEALWARARRVEAMLAETEVVGLDRLVEARDAGTGMILALPHMGNWEAAAPIAIGVGVPIVAVAEALPNERITDWFTAMRAEFGIEIVLATGRTEVMRRLEQAIADNKAVALLSDRDIKGRGVEVEFFGERTTLPPGPATLAVRTGAPLLPVGCYFTEAGYRVVVHDPLPVPKSGSRRDKVTGLTQELARTLEGIIAEEPVQWHLVQPNWPSDRE